jgi:hypothetical protein
MIEKINTLLAQLPPNWMSRATAQAGQVGNPESELRKLMGEPMPKPVDPKDLPPEVAALFATFGMLQKIKKKLEWVSKHKGKKIIPAKNTIACVDADDNIYMGVEFLEAHKDDEDLIAGIMAHEWGHMISEIAPGADFSHLNWDEMFELRREEEAAADSFAGRALYMMDYKIEKIVEFFKDMEKIDKKVNSQKYHPPKVREEILRQAYQAQVRAADQINKIFGFRDSGIINPQTSKLIAIA